MWRKLPVVIDPVMQALQGTVWLCSIWCRRNKLSDLLKICVETGASWSPQAFRHKCETPSGPRAFLVFYLCNIHKTSSSLSQHAGHSGSGGWWELIWNCRLCSEWVKARKMCELCFWLFSVVSFVCSNSFATAVDLILVLKKLPDFGCKTVFISVLWASLSGNTCSVHLQSVSSISSLAYLPTMFTTGFLDFSFCKLEEDEWSEGPKAVWGSRAVSILWYGVTVCFCPPWDT